jgi:subtilisin family serine protease
MPVITKSLLRAMRMAKYFQTVPVIVEVKEGVKALPISQRVSELLKVDITQNLPMSNAFSIVIPTAMVDSLAAIPQVEKVHFDRPMYGFEGPLPPLPDPFALLGMNQQLAKMLADPRIMMAPDTGWIPSGEANKLTGIYELHKRGIKGKGVKVWVLDTGVDPTNPQLQGIVAGMHSTTIGDPIDRNGHGSWCASRIAGQLFHHPVLGFDLLGGAPECELHTIKVLTDLGLGNTSDIIKGMEMALENGADVVSMSLGGDGDAEGEEEDLSVRLINRAAETHPKTIFVIAAGNSGAQGEKAGATIGIPAVAEEALTVGSWSILDMARAYYSSTGPTLQARRVKPDIMADGGGMATESGYRKGLGDIYSGSAFGSQLDPLDLLIDGFCPLKGTSMATPCVAAIIALWKGAVPQLTTRDIKAIFAKYGQAKNNELGFGLISAEWLFSALTG